MRKHLIIALVVASLATAACTAAEGQTPAAAPDEKVLYEAFKSTVFEETGVVYDVPQDDWVDLVYHFCSFLDRYDTAEAMISETISSMVAEGRSEAEVSYSSAVFNAEAVAAVALCPWQSAKLAAAGG